MKKNDMILYLSIAGGAYLMYWYLTNYGSAGHVSTGGVSYWNSWFGGATTPAPAPSASTQSPAPGYPNQPGTVMLPAPQPVLTQPSQPPVAASALKTQILTASAGNPAIQGGYAVPDVWSYYWQQATGRSITGAQLSQVFPPVGNTGTGAPLNLDQFLAGLQSIGLSGLGAIVTTASAPSLPGMSFGGSFRKPGMRGMGGRGMGGPTIQ